LKEAWFEMTKTQVILELNRENQRLRRLLEKALKALVEVQKELAQYKYAKQNN
jgi:hypothetical protein